MKEIWEGAKLVLLCYLGTAAVVAALFLFARYYQGVFRCGGAF